MKTVGDGHAVGMIIPAKLFQQLARIAVRRGVSAGEVVLERALSTLKTPKRRKNRA